MAGLLKNDSTTPSKTRDLPKETKATKNYQEDARRDDKYSDKEDELRIPKKH